MDNNIHENKTPFQKDVIQKKQEVKKWGYNFSISSGDHNTYHNKFPGKKLSVLLFNINIQEHLLCFTDS